MGSLAWIRRQLCLNQLAGGMRIHHKIIQSAIILCKRICDYLGALKCLFRLEMNEMGDTSFDPL